MFSSNMSRVDNKKMKEKFHAFYNEMLQAVKKMSRGKLLFRVDGGDGLDGGFEGELGELLEGFRY